MTITLILQDAISLYSKTTTQTLFSILLFNNLKQFTFNPFNLSKAYILYPS